MPPSPGPSPEQLALRRLDVSEALAQLSPRQRAILLLKEWEGWSAPEIAAALRTPQRRVYHELNLAHRTLSAWRERQARSVSDEQNGDKR
jgi:DNA-directed RNA polymerase specialized sigma24 family protein